MTYHSVLCGLRYFGLNKENDLCNVGVAAGLPAIGLIRYARAQLPLCGMLVLVDNVTSTTIINALSGQAPAAEEPDEYEEEDDDDEDDDEEGSGW